MTNIASIILPAVPAGASHVIRAFKYGNKVINAADTVGDAAKIINQVDNVLDVANQSHNVADAARAAGTICSFSAETYVTTAAGLVPISQIEVGDLVLAYHELLDSTDYYTVTGAISHLDPFITLVALDGEVLETTPEHPFFTFEKGWVGAGDLLPGMQVRQADGEYGVVQAVDVMGRAQAMYNLTVAEAHTFFVGQYQWLVHNSCYQISPLGYDSPSLERFPI